MCFSGLLLQVRRVQTYMLLHGHYKSQQPLAVYFSKQHETLPSYYCRWTASLDRRGIECRDNDSVKDRIAKVLPFFCQVAVPCNSLPCASLAHCPAGPQ